MKVLKNMLLLFTFLLSCTLHAQIAYYPFNGNADDVVNGYNGTVNSATLAPDRYGNPNSAYLFDGIDDYIEVMNSTAFNFGTDEFAVSFWIKPLNPTQDFQMVFIKGGLNGGSDPHYWLRLNDQLLGGTIMRGLWGNGTPNPEIIDYDSASLLYDGEWHHIVFQRTNERDELYVDCMLIGSSQASKDISGVGNLLLGAQHPNPPTSTSVYNFYNGLIDDVAFYDKAFDFNACTTDSLCVDINTEDATLIDDSDRFIDGVGFSNNPSITLTGPSTSADAVLTNVSLELYFRLAGTSCENEIDLRITDPAGNMQPLTAFTTCNGGTGLYYVDIPVPSAATTGTGDDWLIEFDDSNDQNAGDEYSVRFTRLKYDIITTVSSDTPPLVTDVVVGYDDQDVFVDAVGFPNNPTYTFSDPNTSADAILTDINLELYFRLIGSCCESDIALQITDPTGNTQSLTAFTTCNGGNGLYYVNIPVSSGSTTGSVADWVVEFDALSDQNSGDEYSVRFGRLTYTANYCEEMKHNVGLADENLSSKRQSKLADTAIKLYPVPTSSLLNLEYRTDNEQALHIEILSNDGKVLIAREVVGQKGMNNVELDVASLAAGHYYVRIYGADNIPKMQPFVKINP